MTFENFARLTGATLLNEPSISSFEKVETNPKKIKRGDLFIGDEKEDIELALHLEAYAIVSSLKLDIIDPEIAWFKATSLDEVLIKLLRFSLLEKKFRFIYLHPIEIELIKKIADKENLLFLNNDEKESYKKIINADKDSIFFSTKEEFLRQIYPEFETLETSKSLFKIDKKSLFLTSFTHGEKSYKNIKISPLQLNYLENIVTFLDKSSITYEIQKCGFNSHLYPIFVNQNLQIKPFGKSERVLICTSDNRLLDYLKTEATWAKTIVFEFDDLSKLKNIEFNFAIIFIKYDKLIEELEKNETIEQILLF